MPAFIDLTGKKFGRLSVVRRSTIVENDKRKRVSWVCRCSCGKRVTVRSHSLKKGKTSSCGCIRIERVKKGLRTLTPEQKIVSAKRLKKKQRQYEIFRKFGMTVAAYLTMLERQNNLCYICTDPLVKPCIDHCHKTGKIRGILCPKCNHLLGFARDDINILSNAIKYLKENG